MSPTSTATIRPQGRPLKEHSGNTRQQIMDTAVELFAQQAVGLIGVVVVMLVGIFLLDLSAYQMVISSVVVLLMGGFILFDTSRIIHGGETNYIMATISLYLSIYNMFIHLLVLLGGNRN